MHITKSITHSVTLWTVTAAIVLALVSLGSATLVLADDEPATFESRWPETAMRPATHVEAARLIAGAIKDDVKPIIKAEMLARTEHPARCGAAFCDLLSSR
jgi:hypothetical protein